MVPITFQLRDTNCFLLKKHFFLVQAKNKKTITQFRVKSFKVIYLYYFPSEIDAQEESRRQRNPNPDLNNVDLEDFNRFDVVSKIYISSLQNKKYY